MVRLFGLDYYVSNIYCILFYHYFDFDVPIQIPKLFIFFKYILQQKMLWYPDPQSLLQCKFLIFHHGGQLIATHCLLCCYLFLSYSRMSIPSILSVPLVTDDSDTETIVFSGEFTAAEFRALIRGAMDIKSMTGTMTWKTTTTTAAAVQSQQCRGSMILWWQKILSLPSSPSSSFTVGENRPPLDALGWILSRRDAPSLDTKLRREVRILEGETRRRSDEHWERQLRSR